jgi:DNA-binding response OmpR family regulator
VLVVDDDASVRQSVSRVLTASGYRVLTASDGAEALGVFRRETIDLVLLDIGLPLKSGWETFERLTTENPFLPVIVITGKCGNTEMACAAGVGALMEKPLDVEALLETVRRLLLEVNEVRLSRLSGLRHDVQRIPSSSASIRQELRERSTASLDCEGSGQKGGS